MSRQQKTTVDAPAPRASASRPTPLLFLLHHPERGVIDEPPRRLSVGRHPMGREVEGDEGIAVDDPRASRLHAVLHVSSRSHRVRVADESSKNGTIVNGERVVERWLEDGDVVRLADSHYLLRMEPSDLEDAEVAGLIGRAPAIRALRSVLRQVAPHEVTVLVLGESGTGKEVVAAAIHALSGRKGAFIAVNCAAIPEQLAESELFGHVAGAFTGARGDHEGFFRAAHGGTIFLDEVGDLSAQLQPKLLRVLEQRVVVPVGATAPVPCDVRIVAATNRRLDEAVEREAFRGDLFARLSEFTVNLPPLRERREDVLLLLRHAFGGDIPPLAPDLVDALLAYPWPYNVRELMAVGRELKVRASGTKALELALVQHRLVSDSPRSPANPAASRSGSGSGGSNSGVGESGSRGAPPTRDEFEKILADCKGNVRQIAKATGRSRMQVYRWVEQFGLDLEQYRDKP